MMLLSQVTTSPQRVLRPPAMLAIACICDEARSRCAKGHFQAQELSIQLASEGVDAMVDECSNATTATVPYVGLAH
jgi:hypothetical protein